MTQKSKFILKMLVVMILIIGTPVAFFVSIGDKPFFDNSKGTKKIAIVNEDAGAETIDFGKEISPILSQDSKYQWQVVGRSAADKGLDKKEYDAILYIPSNFSENILTYEEQNPLKAEFKYIVSDKLNTVDREKVLREVDKASLKVNGKISILYWSYVSQDLEKVREEFDTILQKEVEFLNTISGYYQPNVASITGEIDNQKKMLETLQSSLKSGDESLSNNVNNAKEFENGLSQFVTYIDQYQEYQQSQQGLLQLLQNENVTVLAEFKNNQQPQFMAMKEYLNKRNEDLNNKVTPLRQNLVDNEKLITAFTDHEATQQAEIWEVLIEVEGELVVEYETQVIGLKNQLQQPSSKPSTPSTSTGNNAASSNLNIPSQMAALDSEREKLLLLANDIHALKAELFATTVTAEEEQQNIEAVLTGLTAKISEIETSIGQIQIEEKKLKESFVQAQSKNVSNVEENNPSDIVEQIILEEIKMKEKAILSLENINDNKKSRLQKIFSQPVLNKESEKLLAYYETLAKYESVLRNSFSLNPESISSNLNKILGLNEEEQKIIENLKTGLPTAQNNLTSLQDEINGFFVDQLKNLETNNEAVTEQLTQIENSANNVMDQLNGLIADAPIPLNGVPNGDMLVTNQASISGEMQVISESMASITENQAQMKTVTEGLHTKAQNINKDTNQLSYKWHENVKTTELYRNDLKAVLNNAFVDGQKNGQIYEHLATPLAAKSLDKSVQQEDKLPPVIILVIVLISGLMIGYFCYYFKQDNALARLALFILLNLIVGLIISTYGLDIYPLDEKSAVEWTIFTVLLITTVSSITFAGFSIDSLVGWFIGMGVILFFITPMLTLLAPNINYEDPISKVYLSIQYGTDSLIVQASLILAGIIVISALVPFLVKRMNKESVTKDEESMLEG
ncbi:type VII secretion protein EsaA [Lysinibacillus sp. 54212]|uniref:type VII secretion protein EsaA n=1 Tax=Lysinibacillus sp. 54212 TaxID=3119829 RepID=UPI002FC80EF2